ncbi:Lsr2 family protein [Arsenicicoccus piscis]|uniref:Lsr2 family protein n=1 Tax=Arsenicicoccus piscis TaxID=673954 RepID=A0ABQ6HHY5_9MICO|nr:Lsr2 family protein [Arsenicicoccus piscis]MCH8627653.1 Lsr2 family protein [Arsenicicoccus piscis]GMA18151.1 Lsr2 family protein [Arsenicicoccus piscis]
MAQKVQVLLVDDVDGGDAEQTITFALDGVTYEIDLSDSNAAKLRDDLAPWVGAARRSGGRKAAAGGRKSGSGGRNLNDVRQWGRDNGFKVSDRGRVSVELQRAYDDAH